MIRNLEFCMVAYLLSSASALAGAGNLLANGDFATGLGGWDNLFMRPAEWSMLDAAGDPGSGSARITNVLNPSNGATPLVLSQCLPVVAGRRYAYGANTYVPPGQPDFTGAQIIVWSHPLPGCAGDILQSDGIGSTLSETWEPIVGTLIAPAGAQSAMVSLGVFKSTGITADASAHYDDVHFAGDVIFAHGFEVP